VQGSSSNEEKEEDTVNFEDLDFMLPPSFRRELSEEMLQDDE